MSPTRIRMTFTKGEPVRYIGHLDLHRALERIFRRARIPLVYSQGYNPRPRLNLASALPLGITGRAELAEAWLEHAPPLDELKAVLNTSAPPGIEIVKIETVPNGTPKLPNLIKSARYLVTLDSAPDGLAGTARKLLDAETLIRERKGKTYDLRPLLEGLSVANGSECRMLEVQLAARPGATGRIDEVLLALGIAPEGAQAERVEMLLLEEA